MRVVRLLIYEGSGAWMEGQLSRSFPNGRRLLYANNSITAITLGTLPDVFNLLIKKSDDSMPDTVKKEAEDAKEQPD